jgi:hypothetical protein
MRSSMSSEEEPQPSGAEADGTDGPSQGPSLKLIYSLIVLAMVLAIGLAALIVLPFYERR